MAAFRGSIGQLLVEDALPPALRGQARVLDKKGTHALFTDLADRYPEQYREVSRRLLHVGRNVAFRSGGYSFGLAHLRQPRSWQAARARLQTQVAATLDRQDLSEADKEAHIAQLIESGREKAQKDILAESVAEGNPLGMQVLSGGRGNAANLKALRGGAGTYLDHNNQPIAVPVLNSYGHGLSPAEWFAASFGARKGLVQTKLATGQAGYFSKQMTQAAHRLVVTGRDVEDDHEEDSHGDGEPHGDPEAHARHVAGYRQRGLPVDTEDPGNEGALLSFPAGGYPRNTVLTPQVLRKLGDQGIKRLVVRSPLVGGARTGGLYARDVGVREHGGLPGKGEQVGIAAAQAISEPVSQGSLGSKHGGGAAGSGAVTTGFPAINRLLQVPENYAGGSAHSSRDGAVSSIEKAPAGGFHVQVEGESHYVPPGAKVTVKPGDKVEAGDALSEGLPNHRLLVEHKGIGEGRRLLAHNLTKLLGDSGISAHRRNVELLVRGLVNHVELTGETEDGVPGDVVPYDVLERSWTPREGTQKVSPKQAKGQYLERPVLHYTIGTPVRPSVVKTLEEFGIQQVHAHPEPPPFVPRMIRAAENLQHDPDWMTRMLGAGQEKNLLRGARGGHFADPLGTSFVPGLALEPEHFGRQGLLQPEKRS